MPLPHSFSPAPGTTIAPTDSISFQITQGTVGDWFKVWVQTPYGERLAFDPLADYQTFDYPAVVTGDNSYAIEPGFLGTAYWFIAAIPTLRKASGWDSQTKNLEIRVEWYDVSTGYTEEAIFSWVLSETTTLDPAPKTDYAEEAKGRLLYQFRTAPDLNSLVESCAELAQEFEAEASDLIHGWYIENATGDRLDLWGEILNVSRGGQDDDTYRLRLLTEQAILRSNGTISDLGTILSLLLGAESTQTYQIDEYEPATVFMRPKAYATGTSNMAEVDRLIQRARPAGVELHVLYSATESVDDDLFRFSKTAATTETSKDYGFGNGTFCGDAKGY